MQNLQAKPLHLKPNKNIPNNTILPLLLYQQVFSSSENLESQFKKAFEGNGWSGTWVNGVFNYHHYHSTAHEALGVLAGSATIMLGGPDGEEVTLKAGDLAVLPAGTGHCCKSASPDFKVMGAYPKGQENYDICTVDDDVEEKKQNIAQVALPAADPVGGKAGPLMKLWGQQ
ncbi:cupin domain-containing protein [Pontibacter harenae]|uniref:cupin domain-containing protein n=1 Tax=Pontibacter harenae TaxID=2894083 RepID=UPI001E567F7A|nr:cupin domain-containing protein [Pontibacter harenae]MCC9166181.1 cupin domain-containing protein [Pontibacter harenae]